MYIYEIRNLVNNKRYIGQTISSLENRWYSHKRMLNKHKHFNIKLQRDWDVYGKDNFKCLIIKKVKDISNLDRLEQKYINKFDTIKNGYNLSEGGQLNRGATYSKVWYGLKSPSGKIYKKIKNLSEFARKHNLHVKCLRRVVSGERYSHRGWSTLKREKIKISSLGKKLSDAQKKIWKKRKNRLGSKCSGNPIRYDIDVCDTTGNIYHINENLSAFCREHNLIGTGLYRVISGKRKSYKGWTVINKMEK